ncbi:hypothetical protein ABB07_18020 [Streptomyces incarnatus]|uniref:Secreted protein n=1 Tax=Streptomyces incarnatus TaxID=665007 RepID=A0ABN4GJI2_9ACTN|nr:hypothetical protein ABB07_18020 [Streptomyces incarnatus]
MNPASRATATAVVLATAGALLTAVTTPASAAVTCTSPVYKRMFYANTTFSGTPKKTDCDTVIAQSWTGAPAPGLPRDNFGVRTWFLSGDVDPRQVTGFRVYRWNPAAAAFDLAGTEPWEHTSDVHWYDRAMPPATTVSYRVTVVYADGTESGASDIALASY